MTLGASCVGALVTELSGLAGVAELYGVPVWQSCAVATVGLLTIILAASYNVVERVAVAVGLCEPTFIALAWQTRPEPGQVAIQILRVPFADSGYLYQLAASIGTCIIPWAIFYQQSASIDEGMTRTHIPAARVETMIGAVLCQTITAAVLVAAASIVGHDPASGYSFDRVSQIADTFAATVGPTAGDVLFTLGISGGAFVAAIVVCLTAAWAFGEVFGLRHQSLRENSVQAPWFHSVLAVVLLGSGALVASGVNLVRLAIAVGVLNAVLLPVVLGFLYLLARQELPEDLRLSGPYAFAVVCMFTGVSYLGLYASVASLL